MPVLQSDVVCTRCAAFYAVVRHFLHLRHGVVERADHAGEVASLGRGDASVLIDIVLGGLAGGVDHVPGQVHEERRVRVVVADEAHGLVAVQVHRVGAVRTHLAQASGTNLVSGVIGQVEVVATRPPLLVREVFFRARVVALCDK